MKRTVVMLAAAIAVLLLVCSCTLYYNAFYPWSVGGESALEFDEDQVKMEIMEDTISSGGVGYKLTNLGGTNWTYGRHFELEIRLGKEWYELVYPENTSFTAEGIFLPVGETAEDEANWESFMGELPKGEYRLIQNLLNDDLEDPLGEKIYVMCEFEIG